MNADAQTGSPQIAAAQGLAESLGGLYRAGRLLVALSTIAVGIACFFYPWLARAPHPRFEAASFHVWAGVVLMVSALGIAAGRWVSKWALGLGAAALLGSIVGGAFPYWHVAESRDRLIRIAVVGAMLMLAGLELRRGGQPSRWFRAGRWMFAVCALLCILVQAAESDWLQSGFDMFYCNYDVATLFNSLWSWSYSLELVFGLSALLAAAAMCFWPLARMGALCVAAISIICLPLLFLYRVDDFFGDPVALGEILYCWTLDLGLAGGAFVMAAGLRPAGPATGAEGTSQAGILRLFFRCGWVRIALSVAACAAVLAIVIHGLIPTVFFEANRRGDRRLGELATRLYAASYVRGSGDYRWDRNLGDEIRDAGPAGLACASGDPQGCADMASFYREIGWNWDRAWLLSAKAGPLFTKNAPQYTAQCQSGEGTACWRLGMQYEMAEGVAADFARAHALYQKACDLREADGCARLGNMEWIGIGPVWDQPKGIALLKQSCNEGSKFGCSRFKLFGPLMK